MRLFQGAFLALAVVIFSGCAVGYRKFNAWDRNAGYSDRQIQPDVFMVTYRGGLWDAPEDAPYFALLRAAELTVQQGREYFRVIASQDENRYTNLGLAQPGMGYANTQSSIFPQGNQLKVNTRQQFMPAPVAVMSSTNKAPGIMLTIQTLPGNIQPCYDARQLLRAALQKKIRLEEATLAKLQ